jgi:hypothetical protein
MMVVIIGVSCREMLRVVFITVVRGVSLVWGCVDVVMATRIATIVRKPVSRRTRAHADSLVVVVMVHRHERSTRKVQTHGGGTRAASRNWTGPS